MLASAPTFTITLTHSRHHLAQGLAPAQTDLTLGQLLSLSSGATPHEALVQLTQLERTHHNGEPVIAWEATCLQGTLTLQYTQARPVAWGAWLRSLQTAYPLPWPVADKLTLDCERLSGLSLLVTATESELRQQLKAFTESLPPTASVLLLDTVGLDPATFRGGTSVSAVSALNPTQATVASPWQWQHLPQAAALSIDLLGPSAFLRLVCQALPEPLQQQALVQLASCLPHDERPLLGMATLGQPAHPMHPLLKRELKALHEAGLLATQPQDVLSLVTWQNGQQRRLGLGLSQWPRHRLAWVIEALQQLTLVPLSHVSTAWVVLPLPDAALLPQWQPLLLRLAQLGYRCLVAVVGSQPTLGKQLPHPLGAVAWDSVILLTLQQQLVLWGHVAGQAELVIPLDTSKTDPLAVHKQHAQDALDQSEQEDAFTASDDSCTSVMTSPTPNEPLDAFIWRQLGDFKGGQGKLASSRDDNPLPMPDEAETLPTVEPPMPIDAVAEVEPPRDDMPASALSSFQPPLSPEADSEAEAWQDEPTPASEPKVEGAETATDSGELNSYQATLPTTATAAQTKEDEDDEAWHPCLPEELLPWVEANEEPWRAEPVVLPLPTLPQVAEELTPEPSLAELEVEAWAESWLDDTPPPAVAPAQEEVEPTPALLREALVAATELLPPAPTEEQPTFVEKELAPQHEAEPDPEPEPEQEPEESPTASLADVMMNQQDLTSLEATLLPATHPQQGYAHEDAPPVARDNVEPVMPIVAAVEQVSEPTPAEAVAVASPPAPPADLPDWLAFEPTWGDHATDLPALSPEDWVGMTALPASPVPAPVRGIPNLTSIDALLAELPTYPESPPVAEVAPPAEAAQQSPSPPPTSQALPEEEAADPPAPESPVAWVNKRVQHDTYGEGTVLKAMPLNGRLIMTVEFDHVGKRMLDPELSPMQLM